MPTSPPIPEPTDPLVGRVLGGHYRIDARIGAGAMGAVYRARHTLLEQDFAVKVLAPGLAGDPDVRRRFLLEARSLTLFAHRHAVQVRHLGEDHGLLYLAMDLCPGETLAALLERARPLAPSRAAGIMIQVLEALEEAHAAGIVHRDVKPGNVMVETVALADGTLEDRVKVVDFGLARIVDVERAALPTAYRSFGGDVVGTVAYMAPEQLRAAQDVDGRSDVFSAGVVLYEMLAGRPPFEGDSTMSIALSILERAPAPLPATGPLEVPGPLAAVVARALEKDRAARFPSARAFADALRAALAGVAPPPTPAPTRAPTPAPAAPAPAAEPTPAPAAVPAPARGPRSRRLVVVVALVAAIGAGAAVLASRGGAAKGTAASPLLDARWSEAVTELSARITSGQASGDDYLDRALARIELSDPNAALDLEAAGSRLPDDPRVALLEARLAWRLGNDDAKAERAFSKALLLDSTSPDARVERARWRIARGRVKEAEVDVLSLERDRPDDPATGVLRFEYETALGGTGPKEERAGHMDRGLAAAEAAAARDPTDASAQLARAQALSAVGMEARRREDHATANRRLEEAEAAATRGLELATKDPAYRRQGMLKGRLWRTRGFIRYQRDDYEGLAADFAQVLARQPRDPEVLSLSLFAANQRGDFERVVRDGQRLHEILGTPEPLFDVGFAHQRMGEARAGRGDREGAVRELSLAIETYGKGMAVAPKSAQFPTYRGETYVLRARMSEGDVRTADLARALADFDAALLDEAETSEVLLRRSGMHVVAGNLEAALADAERAVATSGSRTPRYHQTLATRLVAAAEADAKAGRVEQARARLLRAAQASGLVLERAPDLGVFEHARIATARARRAALSTDAAERTADLDAARKALADAEAAAKAAMQDEREMATAGAALARAEVRAAEGDAAAAAQAAGEAVALRDAAAKALRWFVDATWLDRYAELLEKAGDAAGASAARERARTVLR